ncbi:MAG: molybdenum cofactor guanylyltransferase [Spirochaetaceae bacterium]|nr:molybdenum cofactor guanylyltransferase [Spirochaetaceae bacterium]
MTAKSALILGGGKGSRMGYDKKTLEMRGVQVLDTLVATLSALFPEVLLSSNTPVSDSRVTTVPDILGAGPLAGIYAGLCACSGDYLYVCACDMPFINADFIRYVDGLIAADTVNAAPKDIYIYRAPPVPGRKSAGYEPFNAFYHKNIASSAKTALEKGDYKLVPLIEHASRRIIGAEEAARFGGEKLFFNINRAEDLQYAEVLAASH